MENFSIVIALHREIIDLSLLDKRIQSAIKLQKGMRREHPANYEIIVVSDNSDNDTINYFKSLPLTSPIRYLIADEKSSKTTLLSIGFSRARYPILVKIDQDLNFEINEFSELIANVHGATELFIGLPTKHQNAKKKESLSSQFQLVHDPFLTNQLYNLSAALLIFKKYVWQTIQFTATSQDTFNLEFTHRACQAGFLVQSSEISYKNKPKKVFVTNHFNELFFTKLQSLYVKIKTIHPLSIPPTKRFSMINAGMGYKKQKYVTHTTLRYKESAIESIILNQQLFCIIVLECFIVGLFLNALTTILIVMSILSVIYLLDILFTVYLVLKTLHTTNEVTFQKGELSNISESSLPLYTILCPLYNEAHMIPQFLKGISQIDYPANKLEVLLLLEEDDLTSIAMVKNMNLPSYVRVTIVPQSFPKTKPKACNYGLSQAKGEYLVIFDAEDVPDPLQLKKAFIGFQKVDKNVLCLQAKLNYYNPHQNLLTRFFTAEYSLWFAVTLTGLQSINTIIPLGGTSNHFRTNDLKRINAWDPFNVTEDADLGMRLFKQGYQTAILDSVTLEEANSHVGNWLRQRSRWIKGYMQTYLVHSRDIIGFVRTQGIHALIFQLVIGGKIAFIFINPLLWITTISYFIFHGIFGSFIETIYPTSILYIAITSLIFGNSLYLFCYMLGCVKNNQWSLIKYIYIIPFYWLLMSVAGCLGLYQLIFRPHYWEKTIHGLHLRKNALVQSKKFSLPVKFNPTLGNGEIRFDRI